MTMLTVHVTVNARNVQHPIRWDGQRLNIRLSAAPRENAANLALIETLADLFSVPKSTIHIKHGFRSREKRVSIPLTELAVLKTLEKNR